MRCAPAGVYGSTSTGKGVAGAANGATGVAGSFAASAAGGFALKTSGRVSFAKVSGVATILAGKTSSAIISTGTDITTSSYVLLSPQADPGSRRIWAKLDATNNTVTIRTNAASTAALKVAWLLVG